MPRGAEASSAAHNTATAHKTPAIDFCIPTILYTASDNRGDGRIPSLYRSVWVRALPGGVGRLRQHREVGCRGWQVLEFYSAQDSFSAETHCASGSSRSVDEG